MPKITIIKLNAERTLIKASSLVVKNFNGSIRMVIGKVDLPMIVGTHTSMATFQVMKINPGYNCLLGRPWIHSVGAVTSTLHQKLKFVVGDKLVIVSGEEDILICHLLSLRYIEADKETLETHFQDLEIGVVSQRKNA